MSDTADKNSDDHWGRLASELGLEPPPPRPEPARTSAETPHAAAEAEPIASPFESEEMSAAPSRGRRRRSGPEREAETTALTEGEPPAEPDLLDDEPPPSRSRRGRKPAADEGETPAEDQEEPTSAVEEPAEEPPQSLPQEEVPKRRRRRRSRKRKGADQPESAATVETHDESETTDVEEEAAEADTAGEPADDDPAPEVIADWNVPSWNELIASLYRPER